MRQGPPQAAQKSTSTGTAAFAVMASNSSASASMGSAIGGRSALHEPQRPVSARCSGGMRFLVPQLAHVRIMASSSEGPLRPVRGPGSKVSEAGTEVEHPAPALLGPVHGLDVVDLDHREAEDIDARA